MEDAMTKERRPSIYQTVRQLDEIYEHLKAAANELVRHEDFINQRWRILNELLDPKTIEKLQEQLDGILGATDW